MKNIFIALATLLLAALPGTALAAPQILGLVATAEPVPLQCDGGECAGLLSAFCLQEKRLPPDLDTAYRPGPGTRLTLVVTTARGVTHRLDASPYVELRTRYGYTAIRASVAVDALAAWAPVSLAIEVGPLAALLPVALAGDPAPQTTRDVALATGPWRLAARNVFEDGSDRARAAMTTARLINALPASGDIARDARKELWDSVAAGAPALARQTYEACARTVDQAVGYRFRLCLEERHQRLQTGNTKEFWQSLGGS